MAGVTPMIRVRANVPARRRAGFAFSPQPIDIGFDEICRAQFEQLIGDTHLMVSLAGELTAESGDELVVTGMSLATATAMLDGLGFAFADEIEGDQILPLAQDTGAPAAGGEAAGDLAAGAAGDQSTSAAPASTETSADAAAVTPAAKAPAPKPSGRKPKN